MHNAVTKYAPNGLAVQSVSTRDFLYPDADETYCPAVLAYVHDFDIEELNTRLQTMIPEQAVMAFTYLSDQEKIFVCRAMRELYSGRIAAGWPILPPHLMAWLADGETTWSRS